MGRGRLRFLQATDLCLDSPLRGVDTAGMPALRSADFQHSILANARYRAAQRVTQLAIDEAVDFVLLLGDVLGEPTPGGRGAWFLAKQLRLLERVGIPVVCGTFARLKLPAGLSLPGRVQVLDGTEGARERYLRLGRGTVRLVNGPDPAAAMAADLTIAIRQERALATETGQLPRRIDYIAAVGPERCVTNRSACSGPVQGRDYSQAGAQGCLIVDWHETACETEFRATDSVRWEVASFAVNDGTTRESLLDAMRRHVRQLGQAENVDLTLVRCELTGHGPLWNQLIDPREGASLLESMRSEARQVTHPLWVEEIRLEPDASQLDAWRRSPVPATALDALDSLTGVDVRTPFAAIADVVSQETRAFDRFTFSRQLQPGVICRAVHELSCIPSVNRAA